MRNAAYMFLMLACANTALAALPASEDEYFTRIKKLYEAGKAVETEKLAGEFFRKYPRTGKVPEVRLMTAELEQNPAEALRRYRIIVDNYRYFEKRDLVQYRICETLYLLSRWDDLIREARRGISLRAAGPYGAGFRLMLARALVYRERYDEAARVCDELAAAHHSYDDLAAVLLLRAYIERRTAGYSRSCVKTLADIISGFPDSDSAPAALYMLGKYYNDQGDYNRAFSAFDDVARKFPRSPEARFARERIANLTPRNPSRTAYMPDETHLGGRDSIDISPEYEVPDDPGAVKLGESFAVSLGPFPDLKSCREINGLIGKEFSPVETVKVAGRYILYVGLFRDTDAALPVRIRLAEEYGINGTIVRIRKDSQRRYIYGE